MMIELRENERLDDLVLDGMKVIQRADQFCFSIDTILLAHFGKVTQGAVLDLGTGTAAIPLILAARGAMNITAIELNPVMADIASRNVQLNKKEVAVSVVAGDYRQLGQLYEAGHFSAVYVNPPYRESFRGAASTKEGVRRACHEETVTLEDVLRTAAYALKFHGRLRMVHIAERMAEILSVMRRYDIEPKLLRPVYGRRGKEAKLFLVEGLRGGRAGLTLQDPLIVHNEDGTYTEEVLRWYGKI